MFAKKQNSSRAGFSLIEIMVAMVVFSIAALGLSKTIFQSRKLAEGSIYQTTAHGVAYGYVEQLMAMDYGDVMLSYNNKDMPLEMRALSPSSKSSSLEVEDLIYFDQWVSKDIVVDIHTQGISEETINMPMKIRVEANSIDSGSNPRQALEFTLHYTYKSPSRRNGLPVEENIKFVKSAIPIY